MGCILFFLIVFGMQSCDGMSELSDRFLNDGSIIYAAKVDSVAAYPGDGRLELQILIKTQRIDYVRVYWNDRADSIDVAVNNQPGVYTVDFKIQEASYIFNLVSVDKYGNKSLPVEIESEVYGDNFRQSLSNRRISKAAYDIINKKLSLTWGSNTNYGIMNEIRYTNTAGVEVTKKIGFDEQTTELTDWSSDLTYRTLAVPVPLAVDTFHTMYDKVSSISVDQRSWSVVGFSSEHDSGSNAAKNVIDGTDASRWHTKADGRGYPHSVTVGFGGEITVSRFAVWGTTQEQSEAGKIDSRLPAKIRLEVSMDNAVWTDLGEFSLNNEKYGAQFIQVPPIRAGYFRFTGLEGSDKNMVVGELEAYIY